MNYETFVEWDDQLFYFRILGYGLWFASYQRWPPLFSEREGYYRALRIWPGWRMKVLTPR